MANKDNQVGERRQEERQYIGGTVTVRLPAQAVVGPGENVSADGLFFVAEGALLADVTLPGELEVRRGELVRVTAMSEGRVGIAIRFPAPA